MVEFKVAISYGEGSASSAVRVGEGLLGYAVQHKEVVLVPDVALDPRYINAVVDAKSELVVPLLVKDRCIGAFDLESPELNAFTKRHVELLTLLASEAAVAIENARLWETVLANEERIEKELRFAQRVQMALLPQELPKRLKARWTWRGASSRRANWAATSTTSSRPRPISSSWRWATCRARACRRRSTACLPPRSCAAAPSAAGSAQDRNHQGPAAILTSINRILHERQLEEYYCTLCYAQFDVRQPHPHDGQLRPAVPDPLLRRRRRVRANRTARRAARVVRTTTYDEAVAPANIGDVFAFCTDGISETFSESGEEFGSGRIAEVVRANRDQTAAVITERIFAAMAEFRGHAPQTDDQTVVVVRIMA